MVTASHSIHIDSSPDDVFRFFADIRNEPQWNRGHVRNVRLLTPEPVGLGALFEGDHPGFGSATWRITAFEPPRHVEIEGEVGAAPYRYLGDLRAERTGTRFSGTVEWSPRGWWRALGPALTLVLGIQARRSFGNLRRALEKRYPVPN